MKERGEEGKRNVLLASAIASLVVRKVRTVRTGPKIWRGEEWGEKQVMAVHPACSCLQTDGCLKSKGQRSGGGRNEWRSGLRGGGGCLSN